MKLRNAFGYVLATCTLTALGAGSILAAPKNKVYPANCDRVWAAVKLAAIPPHYNFAMLDDNQKKGIISTGSGLTGKRNLDITLTGKGEACSVAIGGGFSGLAHNDKGDLTKRIDEAFAQVPTAPTATAEKK